MSQQEGFKIKYDVKRLDRKPIEFGCVVLEFGDPNSWTALYAWAATMEGLGYSQLAKDVRCLIDDAKASMA